MMLKYTPCRSSVAPRPSAASTQKAVTAACHASVSRAEPDAMASTRRPANSGVSTSANAESSTSSVIAQTRQGCFAQ
ncbi:hypothetical protein GGD41_000485 [Paraburkholderia bryophila]|uniref:Uncharacterized protein n=1 Tax=Paraburkholderia bryophila TaxID=420952 RepID=A0A7Y9W2U3_9BURK|nr:hypothetical protein [Paraburkholderia bryophila]